MQRKKYITGTGMTAYVSNAVNANGWCTAVVKDGWQHPRRFDAADVPVREAVEQAQEDLDRLAARLGWRETK